MQIQLPVQQRAAQVTPGTANEKDRTVDVVWTTGARVQRMDYWSGTRYFEELSLSPKHVRLDRLNSGAPLLNAHGSYDLSQVIGVVESASVDGKEGRAVVRFSDRPEVESIWRDVVNGIIRNISCGYLVHKVEKIKASDEKIETWRAVDWEPIELSAVPVGADAGAGFREVPRGSICEVVEAAEEIPAPVEPPAAEQSQAEERSAEEPIVAMPDYGQLRARLDLLNSL